MSLGIFCFCAIFYNLVGAFIIKRLTDRMRSFAAEVQQEDLVESQKSRIGSALKSYGLVGQLAVELLKNKVQKVTRQGSPSSEQSEDRQHLTRCEVLPPDGSDELSMVCGK